MCSYVYLPERDRTTYALPIPTMQPLKLISVHTLHVQKVSKTANNDALMSYDELTFSCERDRGTKNI